MKLQSVLYPQADICNEESLYFHREGEWILFDGYFNLFYLEKHHKYCDIDRLSLELRVHGVKRLQVCHGREVACEVDVAGMRPSGMDRLRGKTGDVSEERRLSVELPYLKYDEGVLWFKVEVPEGQDWDVQGYFSAESGRASESDAGAAGSGVADNSLVASGKKQVELAVNICTFRREHYVARNMRTLGRWMESVDIDGRIPEAARHMHVFIVDNGKSLQADEKFAQAVSGLLGAGKPFIEVIENDNTGGCGGFSRGMVEAMNRQNELALSHLLMMDDDAVFDPELFVRLYGFLSLLRDEYKEITVGGALMREDHPYIQHASGEWYGQFKVNNDHIMRDMRSFEECTSQWVCSTSDENKVYGAWWCCCYHMSAITKENLPLPLFVHHDDIQFGLRQLNRGIVFLNGICVWHQGFELSFPGVKQYYNMRNTLITSAMYEPEYLKDNLRYWAVRRYIGMLISYRYGDCEFVYRGLMDFLKGRKWLEESDPEQIHKELMDSYKQLCPMDMVDKLFGGQELVAIRQQLDGIARVMTIDDLRDYYTHTRFGAPLYRMATFNGWFLPGDNELKVITPLDSPWDTYRHKRVLLYEPATGKGAIMKRSSAEFFKGIWRLLKMSFAINKWKKSDTKGNWI